jgi:hypothetical protein
MSKRKSWIVIGTVVVVAVVLSLGGGAWLWDILLRMHGVHVVH